MGLPDDDGYTGTQRPRAHKQFSVGGGVQLGRLGDVELPTPGFFQRTKWGAPGKGAASREPGSW